MDLRALGTTGINISPIGLGTVKFGRVAGLKYATPARIPDDSEALALLLAARRLGVNLIDTAPAYGTSEERLGTLLPQAAPRDRWVICTKVGEVFDPVTATSRYDFSPAHIRTSIQTSLKRLRTDHLDVALLHFASSSDLDERTLRDGGALAALCELQREGLIRAVGASTGTVAGGLLAAACCQVVMVTLNALDQSQVSVVESARVHNRGVLLKKPLASGRAEPGTLGTLLNTPGVTGAIIGTTNPANLTAAVASIS